VVLVKVAFWPDNVNVPTDAVNVYFITPNAKPCVRILEPLAFIVPNPDDENGNAVIL
jgi:hypothetical protein